MICKVCDIDNLEDSKFCIECGASTNNGKEQKRVVSAEEMKQLLWSIDWEKIPNNQHKRAMSQIQAMVKIWKADPLYIPIITAPTKTGGFIQVPKDIDTKKFKKEMDDEIYSKRTSIQEMKKSGVNSINTTKVDTCGCVEQVFVYNYRSPIPKSCATCLWQNPNHPDNEQSVEDRFVSRGHEEEYDPTKIKNMEEKLAEIYPGIICGVCGTVECQTKHIPPIQQQYQEAFENIQKFRRMRHDRWSSNRPFPMYNIRSGFSRISVPEEMQFLESRITGTDVRKGIGPRKPKRPFKSISIRKGLDRKKALPPEKVW